jgi:LL-diaminopimelate aminotransferase
VYSKEGQNQVIDLTNYYLKNAGLITEKMSELGYSCTGGVNSPYIWIKSDRDSWEFFDLFLNKAGVVCTPGTGFGRCGDNYIRLSAFNSFENVENAMNRIGKILK